MTTTLQIDSTVYTIGQDVDEIIKVSGVYLDSPEQIRGVVSGTITTSNNANDKIAMGRVTGIKNPNIKLSFSINTKETAGSTDITRRIIEDAMNQGKTVYLKDDEFYDSDEWGDSSNGVPCIVFDCSFRRSGKESDKASEIIATISLREIRED